MRKQAFLRLNCLAFDERMVNMEAYKNKSETMQATEQPYISVHDQLWIFSEELLQRYINDDPLYADLFFNENINMDTDTELEVMWLLFQGEPQNLTQIFRTTPIPLSSDPISGIFDTEEEAALWNQIDFDYLEQQLQQFQEQQQQQQQEQQQQQDTNKNVDLYCNEHINDIDTVVEQ